MIFKPLTQSIRPKNLKQITRFIAQGIPELPTSKLFKKKIINIFLYCISKEINTYAKICFMPSRLVM